MTGRAAAGVDVVVKIGGSLLAHPEALDAALAVVSAARMSARVVIVPGGGPFADAVRDADARLGLSDHAAHWMAILAMDQYGHLLADRLPNARLATTADMTCEALDAGALVVVAPFAWLRSADPLPHSWAATSDSIAAWLAGQVRARTLVLVKPPGSGDAVTDAYFQTALPHGVAAHAVPADQIGRLRALMAPSTGRDG